MVKIIALPRPFTIGVVVERSVARAKRVLARCAAEGADAAELNLSTFPVGTRFQKVFASSLPTYTSCRRAPFMQVYGPVGAGAPVRTDVERMEFQIAALAAGSAGLDIEADTFDPDDSEWTSDAAALREQRAVAREAHRFGRAVLFSWHPPFRLRFAEADAARRDLKRRGADFVKIVERVTSASEALETASHSLELAAVPEPPFVLLPLGPGANAVRPWMPAFGAAYLLSRASIGSNRLPLQPLLRRARAIIAAARVPSR